MFCTNCGKELGSGDKFCAYCGKPAPFVPLFKQEAKEEETPRKPFLDLDWNIDGVKREEKKKPTETVDFNWGEFAGKKSYKPIEVEKIEQPEEKERIFILPELQKDDEPVLSIEELEAEIFGDSEEKPDDRTIIFTKEDKEQATEKIEEKKDKFYTFTQKQNAFLDLLEKEKERLLDLGGDDIFEQIRKEKEEELNRKEKIEARESEKESLIFEGVALPTTPLAVDIVEEAKANPFRIQRKEEEKKEEKEEKRQEGKGEAKPSDRAGFDSPGNLTPEEKVKLRYSDIFPRDFVSSGSAYDYASGEHKEAKEVASKLDSLYNEEDIEEKPKKKGGFGKFIVILLIILIVLEGVIFGIKFIAPDSKVSEWTDDMIVKIVDLFSGNAQKEDSNLDEEQADFKTYMNAIVTKEVLSTDTIGSMSYTEEFSYDMINDPAFPEVKNAIAFEDEEWFQDAKGETYTYAKILARTLARYYDTWESINQDASLITINSIEIGEIKRGEDGFYVLDKVTYASTDGTDVVKYQTVYLKAADNTMSISELKEEKLNG